ncbi:hypothetical protein DL769_008045 [Monosporascus sp. CRB-8-3]|nr:hypothetical protein DL769_008045 [Monosporascus sp. CRB-8-3]
MGNTHGKEARTSSRLGPGSGLDAGGSSGGAGYQGDLPDRSRRVSRADLAVLGLSVGGGSSSRQQDVPFEHRETRQEREARKLERERIARVQERERSMREEHVDGGYLVTMGIYTASEDFSKPIVRQLQIERKIAPFWRGLDDFNENWAEHQIIAAARGLAIPQADEVPENLLPQPRTAESPGTSTPNFGHLTVPMGPRTMSASSDMAASSPGTSLPSPVTHGPPRSSSPFKPHKALAAALNLTRNGSNTDIMPREINLPHDPFVNGQPLEVFLYKDGVECPLCLMYYPPYLNRTRCCAQLICSECFVQIKRPDPHYPEHHDQEAGIEIAASNDEPTGELIMEPAKCPYCTQTEFGVTYEPPPFRRGLTYAFNASGLGSMSTAMSSSSSLNSNLSPLSSTPPPHASRRRAQSLAASAPGVITTDRVRPEWTTKLAAARAQQRRRAAAADALHHAAFMMGNTESRTIFGRPSRFSRRSARDARGAESPGTGTNSRSHYDGNGEPPEGAEPGPRGSSGRAVLGRERFDVASLESMMMAEAIRLSLADEEERRKKAEKEARKEAKKREKEERKAAKKNKGDVYGGQGGSGTSASSLSLGLVGRRRGNSAASNLRMEAGVATTSTPASQSSRPSGRVTAVGAEPESPHIPNDGDKGKAVERTDASSNTPGASPAIIPSPTTHSRGSSHLRQMSNASSISSSVTGSDACQHLGGAAEEPLSTPPSLGGHGTEDENASSSEPMCNFRSLAEMVGAPIDGEVTSSEGDDRRKASGVGDAEGVHVEHVEGDTVRPTENSEIETKESPSPSHNMSSVTGTHERNGSLPPPQLIITPDTPSPDGSKQLGHIVNTPEQPHQVTQ